MGRPKGTKNINTPAKMWEYFQSYKSEVKSNPILIKDWVGSHAIQVDREKERPLTFIGFQNWLEDNDIITDPTDYFENKDNRYADFVRICSRIKQNIKDDQITGGMAGIYNPSITQRLNNLVEKTEVNDVSLKPKKIKITIRKNEDTNPEKLNTDIKD